MDTSERGCASRLAYDGKIVRVRIDHVELPNGSMTYREVVEHATAVAIAAETEDGKILLIRQFRYPVGKEIIEVPAGIVEDEEDLVAAAKRELREETGFDAREIREIYRFFTSPGFSNELIVLYHAKDIFPSFLAGDDDEFINLMPTSKEECLRLIESGAIEDAKTLVALLMLLR